MNQPIIGITGHVDQSVRPPNAPLYVSEQAYVEAVRMGGGAPFIIPPYLDERSLRAIFERLDGLLLSGGGDVKPSFFGQEESDLLWLVDERRDRTELALARWALAHERPLLAICRGHQVLNVAAGGDLYQDIPTLIPNALTHTTVAGRPKSAVSHTVEVKAQTRLASLVGPGELGVNSAHHQAIKDVAPNLGVTARAPDGVIEGVEHTQHPFCIGVQWHPEVMAGEYPVMRRLFEGLSEAASR